MARRRRRSPPIEMTVSIESLTNDSRGVAHHEGKAVFVEGALPGENGCRCRDHPNASSKYDTATVLEVLQASDDRVQPRCSAAGSMRRVQSAAYGRCKSDTRQAAGITRKPDSRSAKFSPRSVLPPLQGLTLELPSQGHALASSWCRRKGGVLVGFREKQSGYLAVMDRCDVLDERFSNLIIPLRELIGRLSIARRIPQVEIAAGDDTAVLVFRHLEPLSELDQDTDIFLLNSTIYPLCCRRVVRIVFSHYIRQHRNCLSTALMSGTFRYDSGPPTSPRSTPVSIN